MTPEVQAAIRESFNKALPAILAGRDPQPVVWASNGRLCTWDRPPVLPVGPSKDMILRTVCEVAGVSQEEILGPRRQRRLARPRQIACYLISEYSPKMSLPQIGFFMGARDHTTIMHALRQIGSLLALNDDFTQQIYYETKRRLGV